MTPDHQCDEAHETDEAVKVLTCKVDDRNTTRYWSTGRLSSGYQSYLDVLEDIKERYLDKKEQLAEVEKATAARKLALCALGCSYKSYPPWS